MNIVQSIILGIIQGITEFFPVSSSGHLVIIPYFSSWDYPPLYFTVMVHFATLAAVVTVFYREIYRIIKAVVLGIFIRAHRGSNNFKLGIFLIVASIPAAFAGLFLNDYIEGLFERPVYAAAFLVVTAIFLLLGEFRGKRIENAALKHAQYYDGQKEALDKDEGKEEEESLIGEINIGKNGKGKINFNTFIAIITGIGQALAILPGISRSGATISFARFFGIRRSEAVKFSFLLSVPVIFGSFIFEIFRSSDIIFRGGPGVAQNLIAGFISSYLAGLFAVKFIVNIVKKRSLNMFAIYCICLAIVVFLFYIINKFM